jgi:hypothetical protein
MSLVYSHIVLSGFSAGSVKFDRNGIEWKDKGNMVVKNYDSDLTTKVLWTVYGTKGHLYIHFKEGKFAILDGFSKDDFDDISKYFASHDIIVEQSKVLVRILQYHYLTIC